MDDEEEVGGFKISGNDDDDELLDEPLDMPLEEIPEDEDPENRYR